MFVGDKNLRRRLAPVANLLNQLNADFIDWIFEQSNKEADDICARGEVIFTVHPFARQVPRAFLGEVARATTIEALSGRVMSDILAKEEKRPALTTDQERLAYVRDRLLDSGRRYLRGDFSDLKGDQALVAVKLKIVRHFLLGLPDEAEMIRRLDHGVEVMRTHLFAAGTRIRELGRHRPCVFLHGVPGIDDLKSWERMAATARAFEELKLQQGGGKNGI